jgi:hypothetical protein
MRILTATMLLTVFTVTASGQAQMKLEVTEHDFGV